MTYQEMINTPNPCKDCKHALKRSEFSFKKYGWAGHTLECMKDEDYYVRPYDTCDKFERKDDK
jgi:hypothetical protein